MSISFAILAFFACASHKHRAHARPESEQPVLSKQLHDVSNPIVAFANLLRAVKTEGSWTAGVIRSGNPHSRLVDVDRHRKHGRIRPIRQQVSTGGTYSTSTPTGKFEDLEPGKLSPLLEHDRLRYLLFLPATWKPEDACTHKHPVILFMHGAGAVNNAPHMRSESMGARLQRPEVAKNFPFIVVLPVPEHDGYAEVIPDTMHTTDMVMSEFGGDPTRLYVLGQSMGGNGAWLVGATYPDRFAAVVPVCGYLQPRELGFVRDKLTSPVWAFHAKTDEVVPVHRTDVVVKGLEDLGRTVKYTRYETAPADGRSVGHGSYELAFNDPELYKWMLEQTL